MPTDESTDQTGGDDTTTTAASDTTGTTTTTTTAAQAGGGEETYSKADLERIVKDRLGAVKAKAREDLNKITGDRNPDDVRAILEAHDQRIEAQKDEHQRALEAAQRAEAEANEALASAHASQLRAELALALLNPGTDAEGKPLPPVNREYLDTVLDIALPIATSSEEDNPIADAVAKARVKAAPMFAESKPTDSGNGSTRPAPNANRTHGESSGGGGGNPLLERYKTTVGRRK